MASGERNAATSAAARRHRRAAQAPLLLCYFLVQRDARRLEKLLAKESQQPGHGMLPIYQEKGVYNFYLKLGNGGSIAPLDEAHSTASASDDSKLAETFSKLFAQECSKLAKQAAGPQGGRRQP